VSALAEIGEIEPGEQGIRGSRPDALSVAPERLALEPARHRQWRRQCQLGKSPPARILAGKPEDLAGQDGAVGVLHRFRRRDIVGHRDLEPGKVAYRVTQRLCGRPDIDRGSDAHRGEHLLGDLHSGLPCLQSVEERTA
jgi:hypothetical protein